MDNKYSPPDGGDGGNMRKLGMEELGRKSVEEFKESPKTPVIAVLENVRSAYNVGSVFRTADAFLIEAIYITGYTAKPPHKEIKKQRLVLKKRLNGNIFLRDMMLFRH